MTDLPEEQAQTSEGADRQGKQAAREALVSDLIGSQRPADGDRSAAQLPSLREAAEQAGSDDRATAAWRAAFGRPFDLSEAESIASRLQSIRIQAAGPVGGPGNSPADAGQIRAGVRIPGWADLSSRGAAGDAPPSPTPANQADLTRTPQASSVPSLTGADRAEARRPAVPPDVVQHPEVIEATDGAGAAAGGYAQLKAAIQRARSGGDPVRVLQYGDSHIAAGFEPAAIKRLFAEQLEGRLNYSTMAENGVASTYPLGHKREWLDEPLQKTNPDLVIVSFGTNDAANPVDKESFKKEFEKLIVNIQQRAPGASIMIVGPGDGCSIRGANKGKLLPGLDQVVAGEREVAAKYGLDFVDVRQLMGGPGSIYDWSARGLTDHYKLHFTREGYNRIGTMIFDHMKRQLGASPG